MLFISLTISNVSDGPRPLREGVNKDENPKMPSSCNEQKECN